MILYAPDFAVFEGKTIVGVMRQEGHLYVASMDLPPFVAAAPLEHAGAVKAAVRKLSESIWDMVLAGGRGASCPGRSN